MRNSEINISVTLDDDQVPERVRWMADDSPAEGWQEAKAVALAIWDGTAQGTLKIDLWNKEMEVREMKRFAIEMMAGISETLRRATADELMAMDIDNLCKSLTARLERELEGQ
ncbi:MAG: gliding motility protein GldC [Bacteroidetes bacterium]|nr:MAG: gliding motility protein GldC [Bacteroidota bacterium]